MATEEPVSPRVAALKAQVEAGEMRAVDAFWGAVAEEGAPLVEPVSDAHAEVLVTFLWRGTPDTRNVRIIADECLAKTPAENAMTALAGTDVWHKTYRLPADLRFEYLLAPNDPALGGEPLGSWQEQVADWQVDPCNPKRYVLPEDGEHPDWEESFAPWSSWTRRTNSLIELPDAPPQPWIERREGVPQGVIGKHRFASAVLGNRRVVYVYTPAPHQRPNERPGLLVLSDAWLYRHITPMPTILDNLIAEGAIPPLVAVLVDHPTFEGRNSELSFEFAAPPFASFVTDELMPWVRAQYRVSDDPARTILGGASNGGDMAAAIAVQHPDLFGNVLSQSGTFGRAHPGDDEPEWLARHLAEVPRLPIRFHLEAGTLETDPGSVGVSILTSTRHFRTVLRAKGYRVTHAEFNGGHQPVCWRGTLADGLIALAS